MCIFEFSLKIKFPITALREIKILQSLNHKNVITLREIVNSQREYFFLSVFLVFFYRVSYQNAIFIESEKSQFFFRLLIFPKK